MQVLTCWPLDMRVSFQIAMYDSEVRNSVPMCSKQLRYSFESIADPIRFGNE